MLKDEATGIFVGHLGSRFPKPLRGVDVAEDGEAQHDGKQEPQKLHVASLFSKAEHFCDTKRASQRLVSQWGQTPGSPNPAL